MSTAKLKGNASGTGSVTIESPNTNSTRTLTLPDADGTLARTADVVDNTPSFGADMSVNQSIPNATETKMQFDTELWDTDSAYDPTTNYRFTVPAGEGGVYVFTANIGWASGLNEGATQLIRLGINGTTRLKASTRLSGTQGAARLIISSSWTRLLTAGDYVELFVYHEDGGNLTVEANRSTFSGFKLAGV